MCEGTNKRGAGAQGLQQCNRHRALINFTGRENILVMKFKEVLAPQRAWDKHSNQGYKEKCASTWNSRLKIFSWMYSLKNRRKKKSKHQTNCTVRAGHLLCCEPHSNIRNLSSELLVLKRREYKLINIFQKTDLATASQGKRSLSLLPTLHTEINDSPS